MISENCIFCKIIKGKIQSSKIWEDYEYFAFLDIRPVNPGHTLIVPKKHVDNIFDLDQRTYSGLFAAAQMLSKPIQQANNSKRIGMVVEGFLVPHAHLHLVPLNHGGDISFAKTTKPTIEELERIAEKIRVQIKQI